jgi:hypothetical protein
MHRSKIWQAGYTAPGCQASRSESTCETDWDAQEAHFLEMNLLHYPCKKTPYNESATNPPAIAKTNSKITIKQNKLKKCHLLQSCHDTSQNKVNPRHSI